MNSEQTNGQGRGATGFIGGVSRDEVDRDEDKADLGDNNYDEFTGGASCAVSSALTEQTNVLCFLSKYI